MLSALHTIGENQIGIVKSGQPLPCYLKPFITFAYKTGWRLSEISTLTWNQVDINQGIVRLEVGETKNNEGRTVYLDQELKEVVRNQLIYRKNLLPYVFLNSNDDDRVKSFSKAWKTACTKAKIGKHLFHDFRRTAVRNMVRSGIPERVAMMISGHKTRSIFDRYNIVNDTDLKLAAQQQQRRRAGPAPGDLGLGYSNLWVKMFNPL